MRIIDKSFALTIMPRIFILASMSTLTRAFMSHSIITQLMKTQAERDSRAPLKIRIGKALSSLEAQFPRLNRDRNPIRWGDTPIALEYKKITMLGEDIGGLIDCLTEASREEKGQIQDYLQQVTKTFARIYAGGTVPNDPSQHIPNDIIHLPEIKYYMLKLMATVRVLESWCQSNDLHQPLAKRLLNEEGRSISALIRTMHASLDVFLLAAPEENKNLQALISVKSDVSTLITSEFLLKNLSANTPVFSKSQFNYRADQISDIRSCFHEHLIKKQKELENYLLKVQIIIMKLRAEKDGESLADAGVIEKWKNYVHQQKAVLEEAQLRLSAVHSNIALETFLSNYLRSYKTFETSFKKHFSDALKELESIKQPAPGSTRAKLRKEWIDGAKELALCLFTGILPYLLVGSIKMMMGKGFTWFYRAPKPTLEPSVEDVVAPENKELKRLSRIMSIHQR